MKTKYNFIAIVLSVLTIMSSCSSDDMKYKDAEVTPVETLYEPDNGKIIKLTSAGALFFSWQPALSQDGGGPLYSLYFDTENGNFSKPLYVLPSDLNGYNNGVNVPHKTLNRIAVLAGAQSGETVSLKWTVASSRGINVKLSSQSREIKITRMEGIDDPGELYIFGDGTEVGDSYDNAMVMHRDEEGEYEVYVRLVAGGEYKFISTKTDAHDSYYVENGSLREGDLGVKVDEDGVYKLKVNFNTASADSPLKIEKLGYFFCPANSVQWYLSYVGRGVWEGSGPVAFKQESWGRDERYKFRATVKDSSGAVSEQDWGPANSGEDGKPSGTPSYYNVAVYNNISQWDPKWKFANDYDGKTVKLTVIMSGEQYTHEVGL